MTFFPNLLTVTEDSLQPEGLPVSISNAQRPPGAKLENMCILSEGSMVQGVLHFPPLAVVVLECLWTNQTCSCPCVPSAVRNLCSILYSDLQK